LGNNNHGSRFGPGAWNFGRGNQKNILAMNQNRSIQILIGVSTLFITAWCGANALGGVSLIDIPPLAGDTINEARAVTIDGKWVAGISGSGATARGFLYNVAGGTLYNVTDGTAHCIGGVGVCYRTVGGNQEVIVGGLSGGWNSDFRLTNTTVAAGITNFDTVQQWNSTNGVYTNIFSGLKSPGVPVMNARAGTSSDVFWSAFIDSNSTHYWGYVGQISNAWPIVSTNWDNLSSGSAKTFINGVSSTGRAVGRGSVNGLNNDLYDWTGTGTLTATDFVGLDGTYVGQVWSVSADGNTVFGFSPSIDDPTHSYPYKATFTNDPPNGTNGVIMESINPLPLFCNMGTSISQAQPWGCTPDAKYVVAQAFRGDEWGAVWDTSSSNPTNWTVMDLAQLASLHGILGIFNWSSPLARPYSIGTNANGLVIAGRGYANVGGAAKMHAFIMTVPLPLQPALTIANSSPNRVINFLGFGNTNNVPADPGIAYNMDNVLEYTTNLNLPHTWVPLATNNTGSVATYTDTAPADPQRYYRVRVQYY
jgi:hypothetical protein